MASSYEVKRCKEILQEIDAHIPFHYVRAVQRIYDEKGIKPPSLYKIQNTRHGKQYNLDIMKALQEVSQPRDENDELIPPKKWEIEGQPKFDFEAEPERVAKKAGRAVEHRSRGKAKITA